MSKSSFLTRISGLEKLNVAKFDTLCAQTATSKSHIMLEHLRSSECYGVVNVFSNCSTRWKTHEDNSRFTVSTCNELADSNTTWVNCDLDNWDWKDIADTIEKIDLHSSSQGSGWSYDVFIESSRLTKFVRLLPTFSGKLYARTVHDGGFLVDLLEYIAKHAKQENYDFVCDWEFVGWTTNYHPQKDEPRDPRFVFHIMCRTPTKKQTELDDYNTEDEEPPLKRRRLQTNDDSVKIRNDKIVGHMTRTPVKTSQHITWLRFIQDMCKDDLPFNIVTLPSLSGFTFEKMLVRALPRASIRFHCFEKDPFVYRRILEHIGVADKTVTSTSLDSIGLPGSLTRGNVCDCLCTTTSYGAAILDFNGNLNNDIIQTLEQLLQNTRKPLFLSITFARAREDVGSKVFGTQYKELCEQLMKNHPSAAADCRYIALVECFKNHIYGHVKLQGKQISREHTEKYGVMFVWMATIVPTISECNV